jgi:hypothetical protein
MSTVAERRCLGRNKLGEPCKATIIGADGYCMAHSPTSPLDMKEIGRKGGQRGKRNAARKAVPVDVRAYIRENVEPAELLTALRAALASGSQVAVVRAATVLMDAMHVQRWKEDEYRAKLAAEAAARAPEASAKLAVLILRTIANVLDGTPSTVFEHELLQALGEDKRAVIETMNGAALPPLPARLAEQSDDDASPLQDGTPIGSGVVGMPARGSEVDHAW